MSRKRRNKLILLILLLVCFIGIGFAYLSTNLSINGTANVSATTWDVHFENIYLYKNSATSELPKLSSDSTSLTFSTTLSEPGDFYEFTVDIVNNGSIDAMIDSFDFKDIADEQKKYLFYEIKYNDWNYSDINEKDILYANSTQSIDVCISFRRDTSSEDLPSDPISLTLPLKINYVQNNNGNKVYHIGDKFSIGTENFYVISKDGYNIKGLAEYNLEVGNSCLNSNDRYNCTSIENPSGLQSSKAIGWMYSNYTSTGIYGTVAFSKSVYWSPVNGGLVDLNNSDNIIFPYLISYKSILNNLGGNIIDISLITQDELEFLGCDVTDELNCYNSLWFVRNTSFWTRTCDDEEDVYFVINGSYFGNRNDSAWYAGIRPVITINAKDIP